MGAGNIVPLLTECPQVREINENSSQFFGKTRRRLPSNLYTASTHRILFMEKYNSNMFRNT